MNDLTNEGRKYPGKPKDLSKNAEEMNEGRKNSGGLYEDDTQQIVRSMQESADEMTEKYHDNPYSVKDIILDIILFFVTVAVAFGWLMIMLLIVSFVSLSYLHMKFDKMVIASVIFAVAVGIFYVIMKSRKYVKLNDEKRRRREAKREEQLSGNPNESFLFKDGERNGNNASDEK